MGLGARDRGLGGERVDVGSYDEKKSKTAHTNTKKSFLKRS